MDNCSFHTESKGEPDNIAPLWAQKSQPLKTVNGTRLWKINIHVFLLPTTSVHPGTHRYKVVVNLQKRVSVINLASFLPYFGQNFPPPPRLHHGSVLAVLPLLPRQEQGELCTGTQCRVCTGELWAEGRRDTVPKQQIF